MQVKKPTKMRQLHFSIEEEYVIRLKKLMTHHGQQMHEMRMAVIDRIEYLERLSEQNKLAS